MKKTIDTKLGTFILIIISIIVIWGIISLSHFDPLPFSPISLLISKFFVSEDIVSFTSEEDFKAYLQEAQTGYSMWSQSLGGARAPAFEEVSGMPTDGKIAIPAPERVSETTVQVAGIDEPDIVKTDGQNIYFSSEAVYYWREWGESIPPSRSMGETKIIKAFPPADLDIEGKIDKRGNLLLYGDILIVFSGDTIYGYDISDSKNPKKKWTMDLESKNYVLGARLYQDKVYLITKTTVDYHHPCPIRLLSVNDSPLEIKCADIYHPSIPVPVDVTYNTIVFDPLSGDVQKSVSFIGSSNSSVVYMSENALYITYSYYESIIKFFFNFLKAEATDIMPNWFIEKLEKLEGYDISDASKLTEFSILLDRYYNSLSDDEKLRVENELENKMEDYYKSHKRDLEKTGIVKIGLDEFNILASGNVPGRPLNQFSLDEYDNHLRIAVTVGENVFGWGFGIRGTSKSANDVYVLNKNLKIVGSVKDLGLEERIYSARFIEDKGYLVTFRQIDPFFVLDLSDPNNPQLKGELKIPGYSSYLHPISKDKILGIGKEGSKVKISLFDVSSPENPNEVSKYTLSEYWSDILNTHHAFLLDKKHQIFFLPGSKGGYVFSYTNDQLSLTKAVSGVRARRAIYINDYLYIIGDNELVVLNEIDWERINELEF